ncbi:RNA polymerase recycling motor ATPase HelR [Agromyces mediolanus]|uniref:RNA polymerase recycling motor ATPase HelR n=1 Tax=Agromyces mediolanus TaxID=41986 RepID=UPI0027E06DF2|nr:RNA polymerase recycling motor ATPase HelR [Agromyces mediolanus]
MGRARLQFQDTAGPGSCRKAPSGAHTGGPTPSAALGGPLSASPFHLPAHLAEKSSPALLAEDEQHFAAIEQAFAAAITEAREALVAALRSPARHGQAALDRDLEVHRLESRLRTLRRYGIDACLGRIVVDRDEEPRYIGRIGLAGPDGERLLVDWRTPAAEPFFAATPAQPMGLRSRRRYRWTRGRIVDYWDELLEPGGDGRALALDDQSAFIASLGTDRSERMRDVLGTIQADQDAIIRAGSEGALVVDGGPGTGKTVVALHRAAYLLYADARVAAHRGGVLVVGPSHPYLDYVADVLPSLGEQEVAMAVPSDFVPKGAALAPERSPAAAALKAGARLLDAVGAAVDAYEVPPTAQLLVDTQWGESLLGPAEWAEAFTAPEPGTPHNEARGVVWEAVLEILADQQPAGVPARLLRRELEADEALRRRFDRAWPLLDPVGVIADLWTSPDHLRRCAPWLSEAEAEALRRDEPRRWTRADVPYLDAARRRIGDPEAPGRIRRARAEAEADREQMDLVVDQLIAADDDGEGLVTMLRGADVQHTLLGDLPGPERTAPLDGPFAHVVVDEAQELTDAEWRMLLARCPSRSFTVVGDRAQARHGFLESWADRMRRVGFGRVELAGLTVNYRTPAEIMAEAAPGIRAAIPDANVPRSIRSSGHPVERLPLAELATVLEAWSAEHPEASACVIHSAAVADSTRTVVESALAGHPRVRRLTPELAKGLEFDLVALVEPDGFGDGIEGAVDRYVSMTRATRRLVVLSGAPTRR